MPEVNEKPVYKVTRAIAGVQLINQKVCEVEKEMGIDDQGKSKKYPNTSFKFQADRLTFEGPSTEVRAIMEAVKCGGCF